VTPRALELLSEERQPFLELPLALLKPTHDRAQSAHLGAKAPRTRLLRAAIGVALVPPTEPELLLLHRWLDSWSGIGDIVAGMARQEYDLE
jgi:hypothetical protein